MKTKDGGPAFPRAMNGVPEGMSLRDYFAAHALTGMVGTLLQDLIKADSTNAIHTITDGCYLLADAMLVSRDKELR
jgi:hypothetical protein